MFFFQTSVAKYVQISHQLIYLFAHVGEYRGAERQGEHPAAGLHLSAQAGGIRPHGGHGLRYPVSCQVVLLD